jgi:cytochrome c peroxidase
MPAAGLSLVLGIGAIGFRLASAHGVRAVSADGEKGLVGDPGASVSPALPSSERRVALGRVMFFDPHFSDPPGTSCASCHDPAHGFAGENGSTIGTPAGSRPGHFARRNTPSVLYLKFVRPFHLHWEEDAPLVDTFGGFFWDGRVDSLSELVKQPLSNPDEMNSPGGRRVSDIVRASAYRDAFLAEFGDVLGDPDATVKAMGDAIEAYLVSPPMSPFSSKYDDYIRGRATLSPLEARGLAAFKDPAKGACEVCHKMRDNIPQPERSLFTDYGYDTVGIPRNRALPENADAERFDLGLCQRPENRFHTSEAQFCGGFRTPSLRNVAVRSRYMHNGYFTSLRDVVAFYATRSIDPSRWYAHGAEFDDLPTRYRANVNVDKAPYNRRKGERPPIDDEDIDAIVAFLGTLTDAPFRK